VPARDDRPGAGLRAPSCWCADEPTTGLDVTTQAAIMALIEREDAQPACPRRWRVADHARPRAGARAVATASW
jgi:hypothetical protein